MTRSGRVIGMLGLVVGLATARTRESATLGVVRGGAVMDIEADPKRLGDGGESDKTTR